MTIATPYRSAGYVPSAWGAKFHARREEEVFGAGAAGPGKALALDTIVPTPDGLRTLDDIQPGDTVFNALGNRVRVIAATPVQEDRPCYEIDIGRQKVVTDAEHE